MGQREDAKPLSEGAGSGRLPELLLFLWWIITKLDYLQSWGRAEAWFPGKAY